MRLLELHDIPCLSHTHEDVMSQRLSLLLGALIALAARGVFAQPASASPPAASHVPQAQAVPYRSAFEGYQPFTEEKILPWKQANDTVRAIGGWRTYAKEASEPVSKGDQAPAAAPVRPHSDQVKP
jgi:hypothetical protein